MSQRIGIFLPNWIGDVVMATPLLRAVRNRFADAEIIGVMRPYVAEVLHGSPWLDRMVLYDPKGKSGWTNQFRLLGELRCLKLDTAILLTNSFRTGLTAYLSGAKRRIGYARDLRGILLTDRIAPLFENGKRTPVPAIDYYLQLAYKIGCEPESKRMELVCTTDDHAAAEHVWTKLALPRTKPVIAFHAAGGWGGSATAKAWPIEHFGLLAKRILERHDVEILVLCGPNERDAAREIVRLADDARVKSLADEALGIGLTKGCLARTRLLVSTDSGPRHIAAALDVPVVALFGSTDPRWAETYHPQGITLFNKLDCGPCAKKHCPLGHHNCMRDLSVDRVFAAVAQQLGSSQVAAA